LREKSILNEDQEKFVKVVHEQDFYDFCDHWVLLIVDKSSVPPMRHKVKWNNRPNRNIILSEKDSQMNRHVK